MTARRSDARVTTWAAVGFVAWFVALVAAGVAGGWWMLVVVVLLFGGWGLLGLLDRPTRGES